MLKPETRRLRIDGHSADRIDHGFIMNHKAAVAATVVSTQSPVAPCGARGWPLYRWRLAGNPLPGSGQPRAGRRDGSGTTYLDPSLHCSYTGH
jgi:hypothetical protein